MTMTMKEFLSFIVLALGFALLCVVIAFAVSVLLLKIMSDVQEWKKRRATNSAWRITFSGDDVPPELVGKVFECRTKDGVGGVRFTRPWLKILDLKDVKVTMVKVVSGSDEGG